MKELLYLEFVPLILIGKIAIIELLIAQEHIRSIRHLIIKVHGQIAVYSTIFTKRNNYCDFFLLATKSF